MIAYEFYRQDKVKGNELIGILPERRIDPVRINQKSIMRWVRSIVGNDCNIDQIFFIKIKVD